MSYWDIQKARMQSSGTSVRNINISNAQNAIINSFYDSPSYYQVNAYTPATPLSSTTLDCWITDDSDTKDQKNIIAYPGQDLARGYLVYWKSNYWLVTQSDEDFGDIYSRGVMLRCVSSLKWKNASNANKETYFSFYTTTTTNFGIEEGKIINIGNERRQIIIQSNTDTQEIKKDWKFIFDDRKWKVIARDGLTEGLIYLTLEEDTTNEAVDDTDNRIADNTTQGGGLW